MFLRVMSGFWETDKLPIFQLLGEALGGFRGQPGVNHAPNNLCGLSPRLEAAGNFSHGCLQLKIL